MKPAELIHAMKNHFPQPVWPWVLTALRQDTLVWRALEETGLGQRALQELDADPQSWSPARLALLDLDEPVDLAVLQSDVKPVLDERLSGKACQAYEDWIKEPSASLTLARCGLLALALRERWCQEDWLEMLAGLPDHTAARTVLTCLYGMVPDPVGLLDELLQSSQNATGRETVLHVVLSNPLADEGRQVIIGALLKKLAAGHSLALLEELFALRPELGVALAQEYSTGMATPDLAPSEAYIQFERLAGAVRLARMHELVAWPDQAVPLLAEALRALRRLRGQLSAQLAQAVDSARAAGCEGWQETAQETSQEAWKQAVQLAPDAPQYAVGLARSMAEAGQLEEARQYLHKRLSSARQPHHPLLALELGRLSAQAGDHQAAHDAAQAALNLLEAGPRLSPGEYLALADLLLQEEELEPALRVARIGLEGHRLNRDLLAFAARSERALGQNDQALTDAALALALEDACSQAAVATYPPALSLKGGVERMDRSPGVQVSRQELQRVLVEGYETAGMWSQALAERTAMMQLQADPSPEDWHALANCALCAGELKLVVEACQQLLRMNPEDLAAHRRLAEAAQAGGDYAAAVVHFDAAVRLAPDQAALWKALVKAQNQAGQEADALNTLRAAAQAVPEDPEIHQALGEAYYAQGALTQALGSLHQASSLAAYAEPERQQAINLRLGQTLFRLGLLAEARQALEKAFENACQPAVDAPQDSSQPACPDIDLAYVYGQTLLGLGELNQALPLLTDVVRARPEDPAPALELSQALLQLPDQPAGAQRALPFLQRLLGAGPDGEPNGYQTLLDAQPELRARAWVQMAEALARTGEWPRALEAYRKALDEPLNHEPETQARLSMGMGLVALKLEQPEMAVAALQEAANAEPLNVAVQRSLAEAYLASGLDEDAFQAARAARDLAPADLDLLIWFAEQGLQIVRNPNLAHLPVRDEIIQALQAALDLAPDRVDLLLRLGSLLAERGDRQAALDLFRKAAVVENSTFSIPLDELRRIARLGREMEDPGLSAALLMRGIDQARSQALPADAGGSVELLDLYEELSQALQQAGRLDEAAQAIDQALALDAGHIELQIRKGELLFDLGRLDAALDSLESALRLAPKNAALRRRIAQILRWLGRLPSALAHAELGIEALRDLNEPDLKRELHLLAAELAYATLRPRKALAYLLAGLPEDDPSFNDFMYASLRAELALELGDQEAAAQAIGIMERMAPDHPRSMAAASRLACRRGDCVGRLRKCRGAVRNLINLMESGPGEAPRSKSQFIADMLAVSQAAMENHEWEDALRFLRQLVEMIPEEAITHLKLGQTLTLRAEVQCESQDLDVIHHAPGGAALAMEVFQECERCFGQAGRVAGVAGMDPAKEGDLERWNDECRQTLATWVARGRAVFQPSPAMARGLQGVLEKGQPGPEDLAALVMVYRRCGRNEDALKAIQVGWRPAFDNMDVRTHPLVLLQQALAEPDLQQAVRIAEISLENFAGGIGSWPELPLLQYLYARLAFQAGMPAQAIQSIQLALTAWPEEGRWQALAARMYQSQYPQAGLPDAARALVHLEKAAEREPERAENHFALGQAYLASGLIQQASAALEQAVRLDDGQSDGWLALAQARYAAGDLEGAAASSERAIELASEPIPAMLLRAEVSLKTGNPRGALSRLQPVLSAQPDNAQALYLGYQALAALDRLPDALSVLEKALVLFENPLPMQMERVQLVRRLQGNEAGLAALQELVARNPRQPELVALLAKWLVEAGKQDAAVQAARLALQEGQDGFSNVQRAELHTMIGLQMRRAGQLDQAIHHLSEAVDQAPGQMEAYLELGRSYQDRREYKQALKVYQRAINIAGGDYRPYYQAGMVLKDSKDYVAAEAMLRRAAQLAPDEVSVHRLLGAVVALNLVHNHRLPSVDPAGD